jgi:choline dehydrogenase-like flavoprotein
VTVADYLVVGGGTAGCIVAARLSEDPGITVTVIEPGPSDEHEPRARDIRRWAEMLESEYDLDYRSIAQQRGNSHIRQARMRILGGCSTANTMITWRPLPADLDEWVALGAAGWDAATVGPYFDRLAAPSTRSPTGTATPSSPTWWNRYACPGSAQAHPPEFDPNSSNRHGCGFFEIGYTPSDHLRSSTSIHYLHDALRTRPNLTVRHGEQAIRILIEDGAAVGVSTRDGTANANTGGAAR